jgi:hypothetical protein
MLDLGSCGLLTSEEGQVGVTGCSSERFDHMRIGELTYLLGQSSSKTLLERL